MLARISTLLLFLFLTFTFTASADPLSLQPKFELQIMPPGQSLQPNVDRDPDKAVALLQELFQASGPRLGCRWPESCYLLTLSDFRARGAWNGFLKPNGPEDLEVVDALNRRLVPRGLSLHPHSSDRGTELDIVSLGGLEFTTHRSHQAWMLPYDRSSGWAGYYAWRSQSEARSQPLGPMAFHFIEGFLLGYPDSAVEGICQTFGFNDYFTVEASIPEVNHFGCGLPVFDLKLTDLDRQDVVETETSWGNFLKTVYHHPKLQSLLNSPEFTRARKDHGSRDSLDGTPVSYGLSTAQQRWLVTHPQEVETMLSNSTRLGDIDLGLNRLSPQLGWSGVSLSQVLLRSAIDPEDPCRAFYRTALRWKDRNSFLNFLHQTWQNAARDLDRQALRQGTFIEWRQHTNNYLELLRIPETLTVVSTEMSIEEARQWFEDLWLLRQEPVAQALLQRVESGQVLQKRLADLRKPWAWPPQ
jgi:hypothetical protein